MGENFVQADDAAASSATRGLRKRFSSTDHLSPEAVAAFTDGELSDTAMRRARVHLVQCAECWAEVVAQRRTSQRVRGCNDEDLHAPQSLVERLTQLRHEDVADGPVSEGAQGAHGVLDKMEMVFRTLKRRS